MLNPPVLEKSIAFCLKLLQKGTFNRTFLHHLIFFRERFFVCITSQSWKKNWWNHDQKRKNMQKIMQKNAKKCEEMRLSDLSTVDKKYAVELGPKYKSFKLDMRKIGKENGRKRTKSSKMDFADFLENVENADRIFPSLLL